MTMATKTKRRRVAPCKVCPGFTVTPARDAAGRFKGKPKKRARR